MVQTIFIFGGSSGIGLAIAQQLSAVKGNTICLFARDAKRLQDAHATLSNREQHRTYPVDAIDPDAVKTAVETAVRETGVPDLVINCVGRAVPGYFEDITPNMMQATMQVNFMSAWYIVQAILPHMKAKGGGQIVNTASIAGLMGVFGYTDYAASKFAIIGFSETLKQELKQHNIKVQVLCPPDTLTPGFEEENKTKPKETVAISAGAKVMSSEQVAKEVIKGMKGNNFLIIPGAEGKLTWWVKRHFPFVVNWVMDSAITKSRRG